MLSIIACSLATLLLPEVHKLRAVVVIGGVHGRVVERSPQEGDIARLSLALARARAIPLAA
jgi:hypothetical protein